MHSSVVFFLFVVFSKLTWHGQDNSFFGEKKFTIDVKEKEIVDLGSRMGKKEKKKTE